MEKQLKKAAKEIEDLRSALDQSSIIAFTDAAGKITYVNDKFCEISKYSREELLGQNHRIINSGHHPRSFFADLWKAISTGKTWKGEIKNHAKDGSPYWVFTTIVPFMNEKGTPYQYVAIRTDITDWKSTQEELERERASLLQAEKMASIGEMAAGIAHELGNPLATINGRMQLLEMELEKGESDPEAIKQIINKVLGLTDRMTRIIRGMKSLSRDGSNDPFNKVSVGRLIKDVLEFSSERFGKMGVRIEVGELKEDLKINCQETQISQVFVNLINNARDAVQDLPEKWIKIDCLERPTAIEFSVTDSGSGIPRDLHEKIMRPFFTTKEYGKGSGLGLSICKSIVEQHHGSFRIDSDCPNTRFIVSLPKR